MDHHRILKELRDFGPLTEEQIIDGPRIAGQMDGAYRVDHSLPRMVVEGLITVKNGLYEITLKGMEYIDKP